MNPTRITALPNGFRVATTPLHGSRAAALGLWIRVGGRHEEKRQNGISHFLEHLVFKGTRRRSLQELREAIEGRGGAMNAFTAEEVTCYTAKVPSQRAIETLDVLLDMALNAALKPSDVEKERAVIGEEIKMVEDQPAQQTDESLRKLLWPDHPMGRPLTGTPASLAALGRADLAAFRDRRYTPDAMTLSASGDVNHGAILRFCRKATRRFRPALAPRPEPAPVGPSRPLFSLVPKKTEQAQIAVAVHALPFGHPEQYTLSILNLILGGNMSSRLFHVIREEKALAYDISSSVERHSDTGAWIIDAGVDPGKASKALASLLAQCKRLKKDRVSRGELRRAKDYLLGQFVTGLDNPLDVMHWTGEEVVTGNRVRNFAEIRKGVERATADGIRRLARRLLETRSLRAVVLGPFRTADKSRLERLLTLD